MAKGVAKEGGGGGGVPEKLILVLIAIRKILKGCTCNEAKMGVPAIM